MQLLIPRYAGNKNDPKKYPLWDGGDYACVFEGFAGSGSFGQRMLRRGARLAIYAEASPLLLPIYDCWLDRSLHSGFYEHWQAWRERILAAFDKGKPYLQLQPRKPNQKKAKYKVVLHDEGWIDEAWEELEELLNKALKGENLDPCLIAACSQIYRYSNFGAIVRTSPKSKNLNVSWEAGRIHQQLRRWKYRIPPVPRGAKVLVLRDCLEACEAFEDWALSNRHSKAIALLDPPYWVPMPKPDDPELQEAFKKRKSKTTMTPAYEGHEPHAEWTKELTLAPLRKLFPVPNLTRLCITNYWSPELDDAIRAIAPNHRSRLLKKLNNVNKTRASTTENIEALWEIGSVHQEQLDIFSILNAA